MIYCLYTLVDITVTRQFHGGDLLARHQQQNFETVIQTIGLSGNVYYKKNPEKIPAIIFGNENINCWYFEWEMEIEELFSKDGDPIAVLKEAFQYVPFISGLTEEVQLDKSFFCLGQNIIFDFKK